MQMQRTKSIQYEFTCHYSDGTKLHQGYGTPREKNFGDIDLDKLEVFELSGNGRSIKLNIGTGEFDINGLTARFDLGFDPDEYRLIYFRRIQQQLGGRTGISSVRHALGWQVTHNGKNYKRILFIEEDGSITVTTKK